MSSTGKKKNLLNCHVSPARLLGCCARSKPDPENEPIRHSLPFLVSPPRRRRPINPPTTTTTSFDSPRLPTPPATPFLSPISSVLPITTITPSFRHSQQGGSTRVVSPCRKITNSVAFVKESEDPYVDFRRSMLQMMFDREIKSRADMHELLNCFLQLNSPSHHDSVIRAFADIWNAVFFDKNKAAEDP